MNDMRQWITVAEGMLTEARSLDAYTSLGIDPQTAEWYLNAKIKPARAASYEKFRAEYKGFDFDEVLWNERQHKRHQREDREIERLIASLPALAAANSPITHDQACAIIANDDRLFNAVAMHTGEPDWFEDHPEDAKGLGAVIDRIKPFRHSPLHRGECTLRFGEHMRGFHSWTVARDTADYFWRDCPHGTGQLLLLTVPIKGIELGHIGTWRGRLRGESHYLGSQGEWLVPDGYPYKIVAQR